MAEGMPSLSVDPGEHASLYVDPGPGNYWVNPPLSNFSISGTVTCPLEVKSPTLYAATLIMPNPDGEHSATSQDFFVVLMSGASARAFRSAAALESDLESAVVLFGVIWTGILSAGWLAIISTARREPDIRSLFGN